MDEMHRPIGVFDSGVGGISVLKELVALMPNENFIFYGDSKNAPYGTKTLEEVRALTCADASHLLEENVKALVVACNTATSAAIGILRKKYQDRMPVIGIEPALKPAVSVKKNPRVLVMATPMTIREEKFQKLLEQFTNRAQVISLPCPGLVEFVERGELESEALDQFLRELFAPYRKEPIDAAVLGCTHYPLIRSSIQKSLGSRVAVFDGGAGTARETLRKLKEYQLLSDATERGTVIFENSTGDERMIELSRYLLEKNLKVKEKIENTGIKKDPAGKI